MRKLLLVPALLASLTGCAGMAFGNGVFTATIYADGNSPWQATDNNIGKKKGEACASSILGWFTTGDAGIRAAADAGGITQISAVDSHITNILGIYAKYCTVVSGDAGDGGGKKPEHAPIEE
ncbi:MAG: hypothetical protein KC621_22925 [Myxococcales bacterium]|nr:hypothetical protein [Myxococcales bacterium]